MKKTTIAFVFVLILTGCQHFMSVDPADLKNPEHGVELDDEQKTIKQQSNNSQANQPPTSDAKKKE